MDEPMEINNEMVHISKQRRKIAIMCTTWTIIPLVSVLIIFTNYANEMSVATILTLCGIINFTGIVAHIRAIQQSDSQKIIAIGNWLVYGSYIIYIVAMTYLLIIS